MQSREPNLLLYSGTHQSNIKSSINYTSKSIGIYFLIFSEANSIHFTTRMILKRSLYVLLRTVLGCINVILFLLSSVTMESTALPVSNPVSSTKRIVSTGIFTTQIANRAKSIHSVVPFLLTILVLHGSQSFL